MPGDFDKIIHYSKCYRPGVVFSVGLIFLFWILDSVVDTYVLNDEQSSSYLSHLFPDSVEELWMRSLIVCMILFWVYFYRRLNARLMNSYKDVHSILEGDSDGFILLDKDLCMKFSSQKARKIFYTQDDSAISNILLKSIDENSEQISNLLENIVSRKERGKIVFEYKNNILELACYPTEQGVSIYVRKINKVSDIDNAGNIAELDSLTGLISRETLLFELKELSEFALIENITMGGMVINISRFRAINDSFGFKYGDEILKKVTSYIQSCVRDDDIVARLGGDNFFVALVNAQSARNVEVVISRIMALFKEPVAIDNVEVFLSINIGVSMFPDDATNEDELLRHAETALKTVKESRSSAYHFYNKNQKINDVRKHEHIETDLRRAIDEEQFVVYYQPQINALTNSLVGVEGLLRWQHPERGLVPPLDFIPMLEETGLIAEVERWAINKMCQDSLVLQLLSTTPIKIGINISGLHFRKQNFLPMIKQVLLKENISATNINIEITESVLLGNDQAIVAKLNGLSELGVSLSLDDFGTGYSSLNYIINYPIDVIKIDRSFVKDIEDGTKAAAIVKTIINMAVNLDMSVVAEGVETPEQLTYLQDNGCQIIQGFLFSKPQPFYELKEWFLNSNLSNVVTGKSS